MDDDDLFDLLVSIEEGVPLADKPARFEREADHLNVGEYGRASLLIAAGDHWQMRGSFDEARRCFREAQADGGESKSDPIANLLSLALAEGDAAAAQEFDVELRRLARRDLLSPTTCHLLAESYEVDGQLRPALRWYNIPFTHDDPLGDPADRMLLQGRRRVRSALGLTPDRLDAFSDDG